MTTRADRLAEVVPADDAGKVRLLVRNDEPLDRLFMRGALTQGEYLAAQRYAETWEAAGLRPRLAGEYEARLDGSGLGAAPLERQSPSESRAYREWLRARAAMPAASRRPVDRVVLWWSEPDVLAPLVAGLRALVRYYMRGKSIDSGRDS